MNRDNDLRYWFSDAEKPVTLPSALEKIGLAE
jgi:hypothetical protein